VYDSISNAKLAQEELHGYEAFGKKLRVSFARTLSDFTRSRKGLDPRVKLSREDVLKQLNQARPEPSVKQPQANSFFDTSAPQKHSIGREYSPPNKIIIVENLSPNTTTQDLERLFSRFDGFVEVRLIQTRGIGFVEFQDATRSQVPLRDLQSYEIEPGRRLHIMNAK
jgi:RNA recognition motif-containing protein